MKWSMRRWCDIWLREKPGDDDIHGGKAFAKGEVAYMGNGYARAAAVFKKSCPNATVMQGIVDRG